MIPGLVQLGFLLLESVDSDPNGEDNPNNGTMGIQELGIQMLKLLFEVHEMARTEVRLVRNYSAYLKYVGFRIFLI